MVIKDSWGGGNGGDTSYKCDCNKLIDKPISSLALVTFAAEKLVLVDCSSAMWSAKWNQSNRHFAILKTC